jgi:hypothetical protein
MAARAAPTRVQRVYPRRALGNHRLSDRSEKPSDAAASSHHRDDENYDENQDNGSDSDVHGALLVRVWVIRRADLIGIQSARSARARRVPRPLDIAQRSVIDYLPGGERIALLRYQGPEQRSREGADANGRVQHGAGFSLRVGRYGTPTRCAVQLHRFDGPSW